MKAQSLLINPTGSTLADGSVVSLFFFMVGAPTEDILFVVGWDHVTNLFFLIGLSLKHGPYWLTLKKGSWFSKPSA